MAQLWPQVRQAVIGLLQSVYGITSWNNSLTGNVPSPQTSGRMWFRNRLLITNGQTIEWWDGTNADFGLGRAANGVLALSQGSGGLGSATLRSVPVTPAQITSNQDNYAPAAGGRNYRLSTDASRDITGLSISQVDGQECFFLNVGAQNIVLKHDVTSTAANRFLCAGSADITLTPNDIARLVYDSTSTRWRVGKL